MKMRLLVSAVLISGCALLAVSPPAAGGALHLKLDKSTPEADQVVTTAPEKIVLDFSQAPELAVTRIIVRRGETDAKLTDVKRDEQDDSIVWAGFEESPTDGTYTVSWITSSGDGHPLRGEFAFTVRTGR